MTLSFASIWPAYHWQKKNGVHPKNIIERLHLQLYSYYDSHLKADLAALTKGTEHFQRLFSSFFFPVIHSFYQLREQYIFVLIFAVGMAHSLSLFFITLKTVHL